MPFFSKLALVASNLVFWVQLFLTGIRHPLNLGTLKKLEPDLLSVILSGEEPTISWSQDGEDLILTTLNATPFFIDIGAFNPHKYSVTKKLTDLGWKGVNIDYHPHFRKLFQKFRGEQINIEALLDGERTQRTLFVYETPALNTISPKRQAFLESMGHHPIRTERVFTDTWESLEHYWNKAPGENQIIGLLSLDCEGSELAILDSLPYSSVTIENILVETNSQINDLYSSEIAKLLRSKGFEPIHVFRRSILFKLGGRHDS